MKHRHLSALRKLCVALCFFNDTATTEIYTLSLHDALPISISRDARNGLPLRGLRVEGLWNIRSEEHTSELQSPCNIVCRVLLEKKVNRKQTRLHSSHLVISSAVLCFTKNR